MPIEKVISCMKGIVKPLQESKDEAFAQGLSGDGVLIEPISNRIIAPFDGRVVIVFETKHAIILRSEEGLALIIHVGVETNKLDGRGFTIHVKDGQCIQQGDCLMELDFEHFQKIEYDVHTHVLFPSLGIKKIKKIQYGEIDFLQEVCEIEE